MNHKSAQHRWQPWLVAGSLGVLSLAGCSRSGPELAVVEGEVRLNGQPLPDALVEFQPEMAGSPSVGVTNEDGVFQLRFTKDRWGAVPGKHTVKIDHDVDGREGHPGTTAIIPPRYNVQSELKREVEPGRNFYEFELRGDAQPAS